MPQGKLFKHACDPGAQSIQATNTQIFLGRDIKEKIKVGIHAVFPPASNRPKAVPAAREKESGPHPTEIAPRPAGH